MHILRMPCLSSMRHVGRVIGFLFWDFGRGMVEGVDRVEGLNDSKVTSLGSTQHVEQDAEQMIGFSVRECVVYWYPIQ